MLAQAVVTCLLVASNLVLIVQRWTDSDRAWLDIITWLIAAPALPLAAMVVMMLPPLWLAWKFPKLRSSLGGILPVLLFSNGLALSILLLAPWGKKPAKSESAASERHEPQTIVPVFKVPVPNLGKIEARKKIGPISEASVDPGTPNGSKPPSKRTTEPRPKPHPTIVRKWNSDSFTAIDRHALATPTSMETDIATLAQYLAKPANNETEKIRAIHRWVSDRITYDTVAYFSKKYPDQSAENTLLTRKSVCAGYANLVHALAGAVGIESEVVSGIARVSIFETNGGPHAWNAVKLDGEWELLDSTWAAGYLKGREYEKLYNDFYFLPAPSALVNSHLPDDSVWQMLATPLSQKQFNARPMLLPGFYLAGMELLPGHDTQIAASPNATITLKVPNDVEIHAGLADKQGVMYKSATKVVRHGAQVDISVRAPRAGMHRLLLFSRKDDGRGVAEFQVHASSGDPRGYPTFHPDFHQNQGQLFEPTVGELSQGPVDFDLKLPGASVVYVDDFDIPLKKQGDRFSGSVDLKPGEIHLFARFSGDTAISVLSFQVR